MSKTALALADSGESSELILVVILVAVCVVLGIIWSVLAWLIKERIRLIDETQRKESENREKDIKRVLTDFREYTNWIDKRLTSGMDTMMDIRNSLANLVSDVTRHEKTLLPASRHDTYKSEHNKLHEESNRSIERLREDIKEVKEIVIGMKSHNEGSYKTMFDLISKYVKVKGANNGDSVSD